MVVAGKNEYIPVEQPVIRPIPGEDCLKTLFINLATDPIIKLTLTT